MGKELGGTRKTSKIRYGVGDYLGVYSNLWDHSEVRNSFMAGKLKKCCFEPLRYCDR